MGDTREAGRPRMSPQWEMVFARFDDLAASVARVERVALENDKTARADIAELRDQIQRTRDEVAQASLAQERIRFEGTAAIMDQIEGVVHRVDHLEETRKGDVREVVTDAMPAALAEGARKAPADLWRGLSKGAKGGTIITAITLAGTFLVAILDAAPKAATFVMAFAEALAKKAE
jgi:hypothetical protein